MIKTFYLYYNSLIDSNYSIAVDFARSFISTTQVQVQLDFCLYNKIDLTRIRSLKNDLFLLAAIYGQFVIV